MIRFLRRLTLLTMLLIMVACVALLRGWVQWQSPWSDHQLFLFGVVAGVVTLLILAWEIWMTRQSWQMPEPEDPPTRDYPIIIPPEDAMPESDDPTLPKPRKAIPTAPQKRTGKIVVSKMEETIKAVERAEQYAHEANGRVKITLDVDPDTDDEDDA
jgi:hypothetical protein